MGITCWALADSDRLQDKASGQGPRREKVWPHGPGVAYKRSLAQSTLCAFQINSFLFITCVFHIRTRHLRLFPKKWGENPVLQGDGRFQCPGKTWRGLAGQTHYICMMAAGTEVIITDDDHCFILHPFWLTWTASLVWWPRPSTPNGSESFIAPTL